MDGQLNKVLCPKWKILKISIIFLRNIGFGLNMYRNREQDMAMDEGTDVEEDDGLEIPMDQLIDEMEDVGLED